MVNCQACQNKQKTNVWNDTQAGSMRRLCCGVVTNSYVVLIFTTATTVWENRSLSGVSKANAVVFVNFFIFFSFFYRAVREDEGNMAATNESVFLHEKQ